MEFLFAILSGVTCGLISFIFDKKIYTKLDDRINVLFIRLMNLENNNMRPWVRYKLHADIPMPQQTDKGDWIDLYASEDVELKEGEYKVIPLGISMELPQGYGAIVAPRSSTMKNFGIRMTNSIGIIDNSYCGDNDVWGFCAVADRNTTIHKGDKIAQFMIYPIMPKVVFDRVESLGNEDRGGYGTTGKR